jgi:hypothetical protein
VTRFFPKSFDASFSKSFKLSIIFTPPPFPLPPAWICAFKTYFSVFKFFAFSTRSFTLRAK